MNAYLFIIFLTLLKDCWVTRNYYILLKEFQLFYELIKGQHTVELWKFQFSLVASHSLLLSDFNLINSQDLWEFFPSPSLYILNTFPHSFHFIQC